MPLVRRVDVELRPQPKADDAEWNRRGALEYGALVDPAREELRETHVLGKAGAEPVRSEVAHHHPQLQRAKAPTQLDAGVHQVLDTRFPFARAEILRRERERTAKRIHPAAIEHAEIE